MIRAVQIQTIDACNSRCVMCPHKSVDHSGEPMSDQLFTHIADQLRAGVEQGLVASRPEVNLFFLNEPLLDRKLFARAELIRRRLPRARIVCFTNGLLLPKYKERFPESAINLLQLSLYGYDAPAFNRVTQLSLEEDQLASIVEAAEWIREQGKTRVVIESSWRQLGGERVLFPYSSRAGFYTGEILHRAVAGCRWGRAEHWLHFLADGDMVLCCMDWQRETRFANIAGQSLADILESAPHRQLVASATGEAESAPDFICKRCEKARSAAPAMPSKRLIFTAGSSGVEPLLVEWIASLRTLGQYDGPVLVLDYGLSEEAARFLAACDVERVECRTRREADSSRGGLRPAVGGEAAIVNYRYLDVAPLLRQRFEGYAVAHFDADIWFQGDVNPLFLRLSTLTGCLFAIEAGSLPADRWGPADPATRSQNQAKIRRVIESYRGHVNGGMVAGRYGPFMNKLEQLLAAYDHGWDRDTVGCDQYLLNVLLDDERDSIDGRQWNCPGQQAVRGEDGSFRCRPLSPTGRSETPGDDEIRVVGVHALGHRKNEFRFVRFHRDKLERFVVRTFARMGETEENARGFLARVFAPLPRRGASSRRPRTEERE